MARKLTQDAQKGKAAVNQPGADNQPEAVGQPAAVDQPAAENLLEAENQATESQAEAETVESELPAERESLAETRPLRVRSTEQVNAGETQLAAEELSATGDPDLPDLIFSTGALDEDDLSEVLDLAQSVDLAPSMTAVSQPEEAVLPNAGLLNDGVSRQPEVDEPLDDALAQRLGWYQQETQDPQVLQEPAGDPLFSFQDPSWAKTVWQQSDEPETEDELLESEPSLPVTGLLAANLDASGGLWWTHDPSYEESGESQLLDRPLSGFAPAASGPGSENEVGDPWMQSVRSYLAEFEEAEKAGKTRRSRKRVQNQAAPGGSSAKSTRPFLVALIIMLTFMILTVMVLIGALLVRGL